VAHAPTRAVSTPVDTFLAAENQRVARSLKFSRAGPEPSVTFLQETATTSRKGIGFRRSHASQGQIKNGLEGRGLRGAEKDRYEATVFGMVRGLSATRVGKVLLSWIKHNRTHRDWVWIVPYGPENYAKYGKCNALAWDDRWPVQIGRTEVMATK